MTFKAVYRILCKICNYIFDFISIFIIIISISDKIYINNVYKKGCQSVFISTVVQYAQKSNLKNYKFV